MIYSIIFVLINFVQSAPSPATNLKATTKTNLDENLNTTNNKFEISGELTLESKTIHLDEQRDTQSPGLQNFSVSASYQFQPKLTAYFELLGEQNLEQSQVYFGETYIDYKILTNPGVRIKIGNMYYDYGILTGREGELTQRPSYYTDLLVERRGIDLGAKLIVEPLKTFPIGASFAYYSGRTLRQGDHANENAPLNPQVVSLFYKPSFMTAKISHLRRRYADRPSLNATTALIESKVFSFWKHRLLASAMTEFWWLNYHRTDGFERNGRTQLLGSQIELFQGFHRLVIANESWSSSQGGSSKVDSRFILNGIGFRFNKYIHIEYQNVIADERQATSRLTTKKEEALRIFLQF